MQYEMPGADIGYGAIRRRGMADMAMLVHEIEREWKGAEQAQEALRTNPKHTRASAAPEPSAGA